MKTIKRYTNRKLYDTERSCYVTLDEIAGMVRDGEELSIIDNRTGADITSVTMAQIVVEEEKKAKRGVALPSLREMIQSPGDVIERISKPVADLRDEAQTKLNQFKRNAENQRSEIVSPIRERFEKLQRNIDDLTVRLDSRHKDPEVAHAPTVVERLDELERQVSLLDERLDALQARVTALEKPLATRATSAPATSAPAASAPAASAPAKAKRRGRR